AGARRVALAEPALVLDTDEAALALLRRLYARIVPAARAAGVKLALHTYFGDLRDSWDAVKELGFDAIGLDFVEGRTRNLALLREKGFPEGATLLAGVVNGKNVWRADYDEKLALLREIASVVPASRVVAGTSCSLLHVPWTVASETKLPAETLRHFAFAVEKLGELRDVAAAFDGGAADALAANRALFAAPRVAQDEKVRAAVAALSPDDFERKPAFAEREAVQKKRFALPKFPTTTIGSFPQTKEVRAARAAFRKGRIGAAEYEAFVKGKIAACVALQEDIGLDVLVHGEFERNDMVEYFGDHLDGYVFTEKAWVQSYGTRCVKPPVVWGDVSRREPITVRWSAYAQSLTKKPMKGMLTGPVTILNWSFPREDLPLKDQTLQIALAIRAEVLDLEAAGVSIVQIDEAALREKLPLRREDWHREYLDWAIPAFRLVHSGVKPQTQIHTHMCYSEFNDIIRDIDAMDADVITFEASRADLAILDALKAADFRTEVGPGVYDIHSPRVPSVGEIVSAVEKMETKVDPGKLWINPDCGLKTRGEPETEASLRNLVAAARILRTRG
ncbi:MAG: 5-methyltetrahydropteroyltriglutamate--homocysteine S-methyltransferase, partial [Kiritimatiellae bacterium]|nr:5-methyltetrahydropteroyltriglutamate--homocysteine S-methyltransferase [Kiritimatiellia bacterium]